MSSRPASHRLSSIGSMRRPGGVVAGAQANFPCPRYPPGQLGAQRRLAAREIHELVAALAALPKFLLDIGPLAERPVGLVGVVAVGDGHAVNRVGMVIL